VRADAARAGRRGADGRGGAAAGRRSDEGDAGGAPAGSGDILTGLMAGLVAQAPQEMEAAVAAAVYLHGRAGELGAAALGEQALIATDLLEFLPEAVDECAGRADKL
jgi:NAD(P)H-hydrate repair Nnr-like enzyme with NAD(P)H-hydrate dehydratase domain